MSRGRTPPAAPPPAPAELSAERILARAAKLRAKAEEIRINAERDIAALLTAADELAALLAPEPAQELEALAPEAAAEGATITAGGGEE